MYREGLMRVLRVIFQERGFSQFIVERFRVLGRWKIKEQ
jgi:hypothetical protein